MAPLNQGRLNDSVRHAMPGCRSKEGSADRRQAARASSKLTLEDIRSGAAARPPGSPGPAREPAAAPGRTLSAPIVQPETPFANASVQVLFSFQAWSGEQSVQDPLTNARVSLSFLHGLLSEIVVWGASPLPLCFLYGLEHCLGGCHPGKWGGIVRASHNGSCAGQ